MFSTIKSMKLSDYFQLVHPKYIILKLIPDTSIRNYNSSNIAKAIQYMYKNITQRIRKEEKQFIIETPVKCSFFIDIQKNDVSFYFIVPERYLGLIKEKITETWSKVTIGEVDTIPVFSEKALKYQLKYSKEDALSLNINKKCNEPLNSILSVLDILEEGDRVGIFYNFIPCIQRGWRVEYQRTIDKLKNNEPIEREKFTWKYVLKEGFIILINLVEDLLDIVSDFFGADKKEQKQSLAEVALTSLMLEDKKKLSSATVEKKDTTVLSTQMLIVADGNNIKRTENNAIAVLEGYKTLSEDNELIYKKLPKKNTFYITDFKIAGVEENKLSVEECQNLLELPGRELLQQHKIIDKIDVLESKVPDQLQSGVIRAGENTYRGKLTSVYQTEDKELKNTAICLCGPNRSGKSTLIANIVYDLIKAGRTVILPDFCGKCQLSDELARVIPKEKILNIECNIWDTLQGFGYNEIVPKDDSIFELYNCAKMKAAKLKELINLVNDGDSDLEGRMERYLEYAALVVFVCNGSVNDVFKVLKQHVLRHEYIKKIPLELKDTMEEYIDELLEIDEWSKATKDTPAEVIGTKQGHISAILSRVHRLKQNAYIEMMLKRSSDNNINLIDEIQKGKLICIRMYDSMFATQQQKDIYVCYWITKVWGALQKRFCDIDQDKLVQTVILIDELYQTKNCEKYLTIILSQMPKYRTKLVLSCHHLAQIPVIQEELKSAMCSYMFIAGSNKKNYQAMKEEFEDKGYSLEDLLHLKRYHCLNLLAYEEGYWAGITQLPLPIK
ncbi:hypothetical protein [Clostridium magnum]|uniref:AAA-like domain protein n=1 Tax=Clostridium magnum DSM 2767 TaxID=1121326 RepID=A0A161W0T1_9CLOT|nr:hypothetical protein [Clostridium magnum]KZL88740.1 AAA-like domain protein [Clostridium magnum DSM 2767]SHJ61708.1 hypothetical protein SAMN02745944_06241 [Clostridium magnum DSM 2767]